VELDDLAPWRQSPWKFQRRASAVTLIYALDGRKSAHGVLKFIAPLMADGEKVVQQGVGWLLRETWKRWPSETESFLLRHKDTCPRLIVQYATEKMDRKVRERFRRSK
jgi:3-methyladenine DNA glycosylase AlkD